MSRTKKTPEQWWETEIIDIKPGAISIRGYPIESLIGSITYAQMVWLMLRGDIPTKAQGSLLEAALVAAVDHGPQAPSIAIARMGISCGIGINNAMASAVNVLGDIHGGAGQQCMELYDAALARSSELKCTLEEAAELVIDDFRANVSRVVPGFGHRFHSVDPRAVKLLSLLEDARVSGTIEGRHVAVARAVEQALASRVGRPVPLNIDGATAAVYGELGFPAPLGRGLFILSRSVGILAHAYEQSLALERIKGPMPPNVPYTYTGREPRGYPAEDES